MPKFDIVIGNPPYQENNGGGGQGTSAKPLYNLFIEKIKDEINPEYLSFVIPSRWFAGGRGLDKFRKRMQNEIGIKVIKDHLNSKDIFKEVDIKGGICYFLSKRGYTGLCTFISDDNNTWNNNLNNYDVIIREKIIVDILNKIISYKQFAGLDKKVLPQKQFGIRGYFKEFAKEETGIKCYSRGKKLSNIHKNKFTDKHNILNKWKIFARLLDNSKYRSNPLRFIGKPAEISTETYIVLNTFDTKSEAINFLSYSKTHFFEFMLRIKAISQIFSKNKFAYVPDQLDYTKEYTDEYLYNKYNLTQEEVDFIEDKFK